MKTIVISATLLLCVLVSGGCKRSCEEKGGPLSAEERSWFIEPAGDSVRYRHEGTATIVSQGTGPVLINEVMGHFEREEHCEWGYQAASQMVAEGVQVAVEHYGPGVESNLNSARINGLHFSDHPAQNGVVINGVTYDDVHVMPGDGNASVHDIIFSKTDGLIAYTRDGVRWLREP